MGVTVIIGTCIYRILVIDGYLICSQVYGMNVTGPLHGGIVPCSTTYTILAMVPFISGEVVVSSYVLQGVELLHYMEFENKRGK